MVLLLLFEQSAPKAFLEVFLNEASVCNKKERNLQMIDVKSIMAIKNTNVMLCM